MPNVTATLQAMEATADHAVAADLHSMIQDLLVLRAHLVLGDRTRADSLILRMDKLVGCLTATAAPPLPPLTLKLRSLDAAENDEVRYAVQLFDATSGVPEAPAIRDSFDAAVHLVRSRLARDGHYYIAATWSGERGKLAVSTPRGQILARIEPQRPSSTSSGNVDDQSLWATAQPV